VTSLKQLKRDKIRKLNVGYYNQQSLYYVINLLYLLFLSYLIGFIYTGNPPGCIELNEGLAGSSCDCD
jgi:hypothetical protein